MEFGFNFQACLNSERLRAATVAVTWAQLHISERESDDAVQEISPTWLQTRSQISILTWSKDTVLQQHVRLCSLSSSTEVSVGWTDYLCLILTVLDQLGDESLAAETGSDAEVALQQFLGAERGRD